jgi:hypothetical protein
MSNCGCDESRAMTKAKIFIDEYFEDGCSADIQHIRELLMILAKAVMDGVFEKISISVTKSINVKIAASKKNQLVITAIDSQVESVEI